MTDWTRAVAVGLSLGFLVGARAGGDPAFAASAALEGGYPPAIRVSGEASLAVPPDRAELRIGVVTQSRSAQTAAGENARKLAAAIADLRRVLGSEAEIRSAGYALRPDYRYPKGGGQPTIAGYTATHSLEVETADLDRVGEAIDAATASGSNRIDQLRFTLRDEGKVRSEALRRATAQARAKARAIAEALELRVVRVLLAEESGAAQPPLRPQALRMAEAAAVATPIEPGSVEVRATVHLTVEVAP